MLHDLSLSSNGQDARFSFSKSGFDSRWGYKFEPVAQLVEQRIFNPWVASSSLVRFTMRQDTKYIGEQTELMVLLKAHQLGIDVSIPWGDDLRYDQIWDVNGKLLKIQIKTARLSLDKSTIIVSGRSSNRAKGMCFHKTYSKKEVDAIVTIYNDNLYYIPVEEMASSKRLRLHPTGNKQLKNISWASNYILEKQLNV